MSIIESSLKDLPVSVINQMDCSSNSFFLTYKWFCNFVKTVSDPLGNKASFYYDTDNFEVIVPLMIASDGSLIKIKSLTNYYSPIYSIFYNNGLNFPEKSDVFFSDFIKNISPWHLLELRPLSYEECHYLLSFFKKIRLPAISFFCFGNWYVDVDGRTFDEYFSGLPTQLKNTVRRKAKKFYQIDGASIKIISSKHELDEAILAYHQVYKSSWKVEEPFPEFIPGLIKLAESEGLLRLGIAYLESKPIAAQLWIVADNCAYIFKLAYDEAYKQYSAGSILTSKMMEYVIDVDKVEVIDYLIGDDSYKKDWMSNRRERWGVLVFNTSTLRGCFEYIKEFSKNRIKQLKLSISVLFRTNHN